MSAPNLAGLSHCRLTTLADYGMRDGQRFVMVKGESNGGRLNVVLNWSELDR